MTINFETAKWIVDPMYTRQLQQFAALLKMTPGYSAVIEGHTDSVGKHQFNLKLSRQRAESVKKALVSLGADPARISTRGYGYTKPIADNATAEGRRKNRRADTTVTLLVVPADDLTAPAH